MQGRALLVDDDAEMCRLLEAGLKRHGYSTVSRASAAAALDALAGDDFDAVVTDLGMRGMNGIELCERIAANRPHLPVIVITAYGSLDTAVGAIRAGAYDFLSKPFDIQELVLALDRATQHRRLTEEVRRLRRAVVESHDCDGLSGASRAMRATFDLVERLSASEASVLITGETGTGKELVARALHRRSRRREGPFVAVNCAAVPETLLEGQLFGHVRGAFTDAREARPGLFVLADGGTLFLDEIGDMPLGLQPKILRALQERQVRPLGSETEVGFDARVIAATNRDLDSAVEEGRFRPDLYFRINVVNIPVPPLRARGGDVLLLAQQFLERASAHAQKPVRSLTPAAAERLIAYSWPGNVRELENCIERAVALTSFEQITVDDLPEKIRTYRGRQVIIGSDDSTELVPLEEVERRYILRILEAVGGVKTQAAQILGLDRRTLYRKLELYARKEQA